MSGFAEAEANFVRLLQTENLDKRLSCVFLPPQKEHFLA